MIIMTKKEKKKMESIESISLDKLQEIMNQLSEDITKDIQTMSDAVTKNQGALLGLTTLIHRINAELLKDGVKDEARGEVVDAEISETDTNESDEYASPI